MKGLTLIILVYLSLQLPAQNKVDKWSLQSMIEYASKYNLTIQNAEIQANIAKIQSEQVKLRRYPNANASANIGSSFGYSIDNTTNTYANQQSLTNSYSINSSIIIFNGGQLKNTISYEGFNAAAAVEDLKKSINDVSVALAAYYLQALSSFENIKLSEIQITETKNQLELTSKKVEAGSLPELNIAVLEAQLATDSANLVATKFVYKQSLLALQVILNLNIYDPFDIETPPVDKIPVEPISALSPEYVYNLATENQHLQKGDKLRIKAAEKSILISKSSFYPTISGGVNLSSNFNNFFERLDYDFNLKKSVTVRKSWNEIWSDWGSQLNSTFGQNVGFNISIPIFNAGSAKSNYSKAKLNYKLTVLRSLQNNQTLKTDIYNAYINAINSLDKYNAAQKSVTSTQKAYSFAQKRYDADLLSAFELITLQNNYQKARIQQLNAQYDYVFKLKLLELYKGQGIKLNN